MNSVQWKSLDCTALHCIALHYSMIITLHFTDTTVLNCYAFSPDCVKVQYTNLYCTKLHYTIQCIWSAVYSSVQYSAARTLTAQFTFGQQGFNWCQWWWWSLTRALVAVLFNVVLCCMVLCSVVQCCTVLYSVVEYCTVLCSVVQCCTVLCRVVQCCAGLCSVIQCCTVLYIVVQCCTVLYSFVHYCTVLYSVVQCCTAVYSLGTVHKLCQPYLGGSGPPPLVSDVRIWPPHPPFPQF